jgi:outer membrane receptor protein involved in Fe transport
MRRGLLAAAAAAMAWAAAAPGAGVPAAGLEEIVITAERHGLYGDVDSATEGLVPSEQLETRPVLRTGELLEVVPGLVVTQHSGDGKANQYFLRGFNLDHGTDLATRIDGVPVNMPTHAHGQGYSDINFLIPELLESVAYRKGPYYAEEGDFSAAGSVDLRYRTELPGPIYEVAGGEHGYARALLAQSPELAGGSFLYALDYSINDGPWLLPADYRKANAVAGYARGEEAHRWSLTASAYDGDWTSTDQIPLRAVASGAIDRLGFVDATDGGGSTRTGLTFAWHDARATIAWDALAYAIDYRLDLFSNFTYALDHPDDGDQFEQLDDRRVYGFAGSLARANAIGGLAGTLTAGVQLRYDDIDTVGLYHTRARERLSTLREDAVEQSALGLHVEQSLDLAPRVRAVAGLRWQRDAFDVASSLAANSGTADGALVLPKLSFVLGPWSSTEFFLNAGRGFHSNDGRGTTTVVDPSDAVSPVAPADPLVPVTGYDIGLRTAAIPKLQLAASWWTMALDSELLFVGDAGGTEATRGSRRHGLEIGAWYRPLDWLILDGDLAWSHAAFRGADPAGDHIPGAVERVASFGLAIEHPGGWTGGLRVRHFGPAPLVEDGSVRSDGTTVVNLRAGYALNDHLGVTFDVYNLLDSEEDDISYYYESRLPGEAAPVADVHFHPVEPRTWRLGLRGSF